MTYSDIDSLFPDGFFFSFLASGTAVFFFPLLFFPDLFPELPVRCYTCAHDCLHKRSFPNLFSPLGFGDPPVHVQADDVCYEPASLCMHGMGVSWRNDPM